MKLYLLSIAILISELIFSQENYKHLFDDGDYYLASEEYEKAIEAYKAVINADSTHCNACFKTGFCYTKIPYKIWKAIPFLEQAAKDVAVDKYKDGSYKIKAAPADVYYYLGYVYQMTMQVDKALENYFLYKETVINPNLWIPDIDRRIKSCEVGRKYIKNPIPVEISNVGHNINTAASEFNPCVSANDSVMYFTRSQIVAEDDDFSEKQYRIYRSFKGEQNGEAVWEEAEDITDELGVDLNCYTLSTSADGKILILFEDKDLYEGTESVDKGSLYISYYKNAHWSQFEELPKETGYSGSGTHASISNDGNTIYFTAKNDDDETGIDIFETHRSDDGTWSKAESLGSPVNTKYDEATPFVINDTILFFSSTGHSNIGGFDVFRSYRRNGKWSEPENLSIPVNSPGDDLGFMPTDGGKQAYYSVERPDGYLSFGGRDIYHIILEAEKDSVINETETADSLVADSVQAVQDSATTAMIDEQQEVSVDHDKEELVEDTVVYKESIQNTEDENLKTDKRVISTVAEIGKASGCEIQLFSSNIPFNIEEKFPGLEVRERYGNAGYYRYTTGNYASFSEAKADLPRIKELGYPDAFIKRTQAYLDDQIVFDKTKNYTVQILATMVRTNAVRKFSPLKNIAEFLDDDGMYTYCVGSFDTWAEAKELLDKVKELGFACYIMSMDTYKQ